MYLQTQISGEDVEITLKEPQTSLDLTLVSKPDNPLMITKDLEAWNSEDDVSTFGVTPTSLSGVTGDEPVEVPIDSFDVSVRPAEDENAILDEITLDTNSPGVTGETDTGFTITVRKQAL